MGIIGHCPTQWAQNGGAPKGRERRGRAHLEWTIKGTEEMYHTGGRKNPDPGPGDGLSFLGTSLSLCLSPRDSSHEKKKYKKQERSGI